jgi:hypothetical protein
MFGGRIMKFARTLSVVALAAVVAAGCSDSTGPEDLTVADLVGTWTATSMNYTEDAGAGQFDVIANAAATLELVIAAGGAVTGTYVLIPLEQTVPFTGMVSVANGVLTLTGFPLYPSMVMTVTEWTGGNTIQMVFTDVEFDFDWTDGIENNEVPADLTITLTRG